MAMRDVGRRRGRATTTKKRMRRDRAEGRGVAERAPRAARMEGKRKRGGQTG